MGDSALVYEGNLTQIRGRSIPSKQIEMRIQAPCPSPGKEPKTPLLMAVGHHVLTLFPADESSCGFHAGCRLVGPAGFWNNIVHRYRVCSARTGALIGILVPAEGPEVGDFTGTVEEVFGEGRQSGSTLGLAGPALPCFHEAISLLTATQVSSRKCILGCKRGIHVLHLLFQ